MRFHKFPRYSRYTATQISLTRRKIQGGLTNLSTCIEVMNAIYAYHIFPVDFGICHGVRLGQEVDHFKQVFQRGEWIGTDIAPEACDGTKVVCWDFNKPNPAWIGRTDIIYTNSLDHSPDPLSTLVCWIVHLRNNDSRLYVEWTKCHTWLGKRGHKADCFAATLEEYRQLLSDVGTVYDVLRVRGGYRNLKRHIFCVGRK